jgi:hypothetical protein
VRVVSPPHDPEPGPDEPFAPVYDFVRESGQRAATGLEAARAELGPTTAVAGTWRELPGTRHLPDPYGPDPVVFGRMPRVGPT